MRRADGDKERNERMGEMHTRVYLDGKVEALDFPLADISDQLARDGTVVWVDLCGPTTGQLHELALELGLHELAVEDALSPHQRPKIDHYETHLFMSCHAVRVAGGKALAGDAIDDASVDAASLGVDGQPDVLHDCEIDAFVGARWMITVRKDERFSMAPVLERWDRSGALARHGVSFLLYGLLDVVIDGYFDATQAFDDFYDEVSEGLFEERPLDPEAQRAWFHMRRALVRFHRLAVPMREAVSTLMRREHDFVPDELYPYYQDLYDHILRVSESTDSLRDLVSTIVETNISLRDFRQNQVMKKVTSWAAIIAVPTLVTGFYGMNVPYPGFGHQWGVWASVGLMGALSVGLYGAFKKRGWL
jgi:magnesium transporter